MGTVMSEGQLTTVEQARAFMLAGNARVTLRSLVTGSRYTYRIRSAPSGAAVHFVSLLSQSDNENGYEFLGSIFSAITYKPGRKSRISPLAPSAAAFAWAWGKLCRDMMPDRCEIWHEGACGRCGRSLTVPESIARGLGPECAGMR
jgi:hypothetical protein